MREITLLCVGKLKEPFWAAACAEYQKRLGAYTRLDVIEIPEKRLSAAPGPAEIARALEAEAQMVRARIPKGALTAALCIEGKSCDSPAFSKTLFDAGLGGVSRLCFLIGGSYGLAESIKDSADLCISLSAMTFPHHLARVMLLEQIYRAFQIGTHGNYHK